jgi:hypothetical protein
LWAGYGCICDPFPAHNLPRRSAPPSLRADRPRAEASRRPSGTPPPAPHPKRVLRNCVGRGVEEPSARRRDRQVGCGKLAAPACLARLPRRGPDPEPLPELQADAAGPLQPDDEAAVQRRHVGRVAERGALLSLPHHPAATGAQPDDSYRAVAAVGDHRVRAIDIGFAERPRQEPEQPARPAGAVTDVQAQPTEAMNLDGPASARVGARDAAAIAPRSG